MRKSTEQDIITVICANYVDLIVPELLEKSFEPYLKIDFSKKQFQVSPYENAHATAGIVLTVLALEAYRNRIFYVKRKSVKNGVEESLSEIMHSNDNSFPRAEFKALLNEVFILRDVIVHNHIYKVKIELDENWEMLGHRQKLLKGYGDPKFRKLVNSRTKKTDILKLNVQPAKIGFEELFKILVVFDLFIGISEKLLGNSSAPFRFSKKINDIWIDDLYIYLTHFYTLIPNKKRLNQLDKILVYLKNKYEEYLPENRDFFITNVCSKCGQFGFKKLNDEYHCLKCNFEIRFTSTPHSFLVETIEKNEK